MSDPVTFATTPQIRSSLQALLRVAPNDATAHSLEGALLALQSSDAEPCSTSAPMQEGLDGCSHLRWVHSQLRRRLVGERRWERNLLVCDMWVRTASRHWMDEPRTPSAGR